MRRLEDEDVIKGNAWGRGFRTAIVTIASDLAAKPELRTLLRAYVGVWPQTANAVRRGFPEDCSLGEAHWYGAVIAVLWSLYDWSRALKPEAKVLIELEIQRLSTLRAASSDAAYYAIIFVGIAFIILALIRSPPADGRTIELLCGAICGAFLWNLRDFVSHYFDVAIALSASPLPPVLRRNVLAWLVNIKSGLILLYTSMPFLFAAVVTDVCVVGLHSLYPLHIQTLHNLKYFETYVACFTVALTFPAVTIAIGIWKQSSTEARLIAQAASLRDYYLDLADKMEGVPKVETPGTIALKGIGETFNDAVYSLQVDQPRLRTWFQALVACEERRSVRPSALTAIRSIMGPFVQGAAWRVAVSSAMNYAIYAALTSISLAILSWRAENVYGVCAAVFALVIALRATTRFLAGEQIPLPPAERRWSAAKR